MADAPAPEAKGSSFGFLARKIGPVPIWVIGLVGFGAYYWYSHRKAAAAPAAAAPQIIEVAGQRGARGPAGSRGKAGRNAPPDRDRPPNREDARVAVPNVVGQKFGPGSERIKDAGLIAQRSAPYVGTVRSESPHAGNRVEKGTVVTLRGKPWPGKRGEAAAVPPPAMVAAPMTAGDIYGSVPTAMPDGSTYDSGDVASTMGAAVAVAG